MAPRHLLPLCAWTAAAWGCWKPASHRQRPEAVDADTASDTGPGDTGPPSDTGDSGDTGVAPPAGACRPHNLDADGDGYLCIGDDAHRDCDDHDPSVHPGAPDPCEDDIDQDCDDYDFCEFTATSAAEAYGRMSGTTDYDLVGVHSAKAGDQDGDGLDDLWVSRARCDNSAEGPGMVQLVKGPFPEGHSFITDPIDVGAIESGEQDCFGNAIATVPDANGDGLPELAIGLDTEEAGGIEEAGALYLFLSPFDGVVDTSSAVGRATGEAAEDHAAALLAGVGGFSSPGSSHVLAGTYAGDQGGSGHAGYLVDAQVFEGDGSIGDAAIRFVGEEPWDAAGLAVGCAGDLDGDGLADVAIGAPGDDTEAYNGGAAYVVLGSPWTGTLDLAEADGKWTGKGYTAPDKAGRDVEPAGDFDGDGLGDLIVASDMAAGTCGGNCTDAGKVWVVLGPATGRGSLADAFLLVQGWYWNQFAGYHVAGADLDGDGHGDLVVSAPDEYHPIPEGQGGGMVHLFFGPVSGTTTTDLADRHWQSEGEWNSFGTKVVVGYDGDGDGRDDLLVGDAVNQETVRSGGALYLFTDF